MIRKKRIVSGIAQSLAPITFETRTPSLALIKLSDDKNNRDLQDQIYIFSEKPLKSMLKIMAITSQIFGRSYSEFPRWLPLERAFETLTAPHPYRSLR